MIKINLRKFYCQCGCNKEIKLRKHHNYIGVPEYIHGHNRKGKNQSEYQKKVASEIHSGNTYFKDKHHTNESKKKMSLWHKNKKCSKETKEKISKSKKGTMPWNACLKGCYSDTVIKEKKERLKGIGFFKDKHHTNESKKKMSESQKGKVAWNKGLKYSIEKSTKNYSDASKKRWENSGYRDKVVKNIILGNLIKPNKPELYLQSLLNELYPKDWEYVGDGKVVLNGFCPDFININGKKQIIELFGDYWHSRKDAIGRNKYRIECYRRLGYATLVVWEKELKDINTVKEKISNWVSL